MAGSGSWMIYGAYGYTGRLIAAQAAAEGDAPILAGRREEPLREMAAELDLPYRAFPLDRRAAAKLDDVDLVIHCAGPFSATAEPMVEACLATGTHYLDITGELEVIEWVLGRHERARRAGCALLPGSGFDVVPSDCLAALVASCLPGATSLELAFDSLGGTPSAGTTKTMLEAIPSGGRIRRHGRIEKVPLVHKTRWIPFPKGRKLGAAIPWGDVASAYHSTGIPTITVYNPQPWGVVPLLKLLRPFAPIFGWGPIQRRLARLVEGTVSGPDEATRNAGRVQLWARVERDDGQSVEATLEVREGYRFTVDATLAITERVLAGEVPPGAWTPSQALGAEFVTVLPEVELRLPAGEPQRV